MEYTIYTLADPRKGEVRYVGATSTPLPKRMAKHWYVRREDFPRGNWFAELDALGLKPVVAVIETADESNWREREKHWINVHKAIGCRLVNEGNRHSPEAIAKMRATKTGRPATFKDPVARNRQISVRLTGRAKSADHRAKLSAALKGRSVMPAEARRTANVMYDAGVSIRQIAFRLGFSWDVVSRAVSPPR